MRHEEVQRERWSPGGQAEWEQTHAEAMGRLRNAKTYMLVTIAVDEEGKVDAGVLASNCATVIESRLMLHVAAHAVDSMAETLGSPMCSVCDDTGMDGGRPCEHCPRAAE